MKISTRIEQHGPGNLWHPIGVHAEILNPNPRFQPSWGRQIDLHIGYWRATRIVSVRFKPSKKPAPTPAAFPWKEGAF